MIIYLAGPINGCTDSECTDWREKAKLLLSPHTTLDPMARDYRGLEAAHFIEIVEGDQADINACDVLLVNAPYPSFGTAMEVIYGWLNGKRVVTIASGKISPWLRYHSDFIFSDLEEAVACIQSFSGGHPG